MKLINKYIYNIYLAISISIILRLSLINAFGDTTLEYEWGILFNNFQKSGILSYYSTIDGEAIPTVFMPPLYAYFIFFLDAIFPSEIDLVRSILIFQIIISAVSILLFYKVALIFFSKKVSLILTYVLIFFPIYIISCLQISSISLQFLLNLLFLYIVLKVIKKSLDYRSFLLLGFVSGLTMLLRGEFILIFIFTLLFLKFNRKINFKEIFIIITITVLTISPYLIRNYLNFEKITITKSFGYNLWKGNNLDSSVEGSDSTLAFESFNVREKLKKIEKNSLYDFNRDNLFLKESIKFINENPFLFAERYLKKFLAFTFFNPQSNYPGYHHPLNIFSLAILSLGFLASILFYKQKNSLAYNYLIFNLFLTIAIFSIFFILPRYKLIILPTQLLISNFIFVKLFLNRYKKKGV